MKKNVTIILVILIIAVLMYLPFKCFLINEAQVLTSYVLLLTLLAVLWYSLETRGLRKLSAEHLELSFKPHLFLVFMDNRRFHLSNIGNGPAIGIRIEDAIEEITEGVSIHLKFVVSPILKKDERVPIGINLLTAERERQASSFELGFITPPAATRTIFLTVRFQNLIGKEYLASLKIGQGMYEGTSTQHL